MNYKSPVYSVTPIHYTKLQANNYNPNTVPATELKLLENQFGKMGLRNQLFVIPWKTAINMK